VFLRQETWKTLKKWRTWSQSTGPLLPYTPPQKLVTYSSTHTSRSRSLTQKSQQTVPVSLSTTCRHSRKDTAAFRTPLDSTARLAKAEIRQTQPDSDRKWWSFAPNRFVTATQSPTQAVSDFRPFIIAPAYAARPTHLALYTLFITHIYPASFVKDLRQTC
jgi:cytoskeletal protein RodZ